MRFTFLGNFQVPYCSEVHHARSIESLGHSVIKLQENETTTDKVLEQARQSNALIWVHTHGWNTQGSYSMEQVANTLKQEGIPVIAYHLDLYYGIPERWAQYQTDPYMRCISHFFTVDYPLVQILRDRGIEAHFMPPGILADEAYSVEIKKVYDVAFFGGVAGYHPEWTHRQELVQYLRRAYGSRFHHFGNGGNPTVRGHELNETIGKCKVIVGDSYCSNFTYEHYTSDRHIEIVGRGGYMIYPRIPGIEQWGLTEGIEIDYYEYGQFPELKRKIDYALNMPNYTKRVSEAGQKAIQERHTYKHRWADIIKFVFNE